MIIEIVSFKWGEQYSIMGNLMDFALPSKREWKSKTQLAFSINQVSNEHKSQVV